LLAERRGNRHHAQLMLTRNLLLLGTALLIFAVGVIKPYYNWDIIGYIASAYYEDGYRGQELSERTYRDVRAAVSKEAFAGMTEGEYIETVYKDPRSLEEQLPFYSIRVVYVELMRALKAAGVGYATGSYLIGAFFAALSVIVLGATMSVAGIPLAGLPVVVVASGFGDLSRLSTPDSLACFFGLWTMYCLLTNRKLVFVLAALLPLMRTDTIVLSAIVMAYTFWKGEKALSTLSFAAAAAVYLLINRSHGNYGWATLFNFVLIKVSPYPAEMAISHRLSDYVLAYRNAYLDLLTDPNFLVLACLLAIYACIVRWSEVKNMAGRDVFFSIPLLLIGARLVLYPAYEQRYFSLPVSLILAGLIGVVSDVLRSPPAAVSAERA